MAELVRQGRVDEDDLIVVCVHAAACLTAAGNDRGAGVAQFPDVPCQILVGVVSGRNDQCFTHGQPSLPDGFFVPAVCGRIWNAPLRVVVGADACICPRVDASIDPDISQSQIIRKLCARSHASVSGADSASWQSWVWYSKYLFCSATGSSALINSLWPATVMASRSAGQGFPRTGGSAGVEKVAG